MNIHLLDYLALKLNCNVSDIAAQPKSLLIQELNSINMDISTTKDWIDTKIYLTKDYTYFSANKWKIREDLIIELTNQ